MPASMDHATLEAIMKHRWLGVKRRTEAELERAIEDAFEHVVCQFKMEIGRIYIILNKLI